jgi:hypothetical protein
MKNIYCFIYRKYTTVYEEEQRTQWPKEKGQKDKQPSTNHTYKTEDKKNMNPTENRGLTQVLH